MYQWHTIGGGMMWVFWILIVLALILLVALVSRRGGGSGRLEKSAQDILQKRYARGEIDRETFKQMQDDISQ